MSDSSFLTGTNLRRTSPSFGERPDRKGVMILAGPNCIPLLWWTIFRPEDLLTDATARELAGDDEPVPAPVVERSKAAARIAAALPHVERLYPKGGSLARHAELLLAAVRDKSVKTKFLTLEHIQISASFTAADYTAAQLDLLACMAGKKVARLPVTLKFFTNVAGTRKFVLPDEVTKERFSKGVQEDMYGLLGAGARRLAAWEVLKPVPPALDSPAKIQEALLGACYQDDFERAREMLALGGKPHRKDSQGYTPFQLAVRRSLRIVKFLLASGFEPTPEAVCSAAHWGNTTMLRLLLDAGGDPHSIAKDHVWGVQFAVTLAGVSHPSKARADKVKLLLERGADVNAVNPNGETCLGVVHRNADTLLLMLPFATRKTRQDAIAQIKADIEARQNRNVPEFLEAMRENLKLVQEFAAPRSRPRRKTDGGR